MLLWKLFSAKFKIGEFATHKIQFIFNLFSLFADFDEISVCLMKTQPSRVDQKIFHLFIAANVELASATDMIPANNSLYVRTLFSISSKHSIPSSFEIISTTQKYDVYPTANDGSSSFSLKSLKKVLLVYELCAHIIILFCESNVVVA